MNRKAHDHFEANARQLEEAVRLENRVLKRLLEIAKWQQRKRTRRPRAIIGLVCAAVFMLVFVGCSTSQRQLSGNTGQLPEAIMPPMPTVSHVAMSRTMVTSVVAPPAPAVRTLTLTASSSCYLQVTTNLSKWADYGVLKTNLTLTNNLPVALFRAIAKVPLAWDSSPDTNVAGYRIYAGQSSHSYTKAYDAGLTNSFVCPCWFATNYFAATAYDSAGIESDLSNEAVWTNQPVTLYIK